MKPRLAKPRIYIAVLAAFCCIALFHVLRGRSSVFEFCTKSRDLSLVQITFRGQGWRAVISDNVALRYLCLRPKLDALPESEHLNAGYTFNAVLSDKWGRIGSVDVLLAEDQRVIRFTRLDSIFDDGQFSFALIDSNSPPKLRALFGFLLTNENTGELWIDGNVQP